MFGSALDRDFTKNFLISCGAHAALVVIAFFGGQTLMKIFNVDDHVEIIRSSVRVDVVGMPKLTVQELKAMQNSVAETVPEEPKGAKVETKAPETEDVIKEGDLVIQEEGKKKKKNSFMNLISDYSSKKVAPKERKKGEKTGTSNKALDTLILEGNRLSKGSALVGDYTDQENSEFAAYVQTLPEVVRKFWKLPSYLLNQGLKCRMRIYLSPNGELIKVELHESSGQAEFDARAEKAVREAAPFPKPSETVAARLASSGIILGFPL